MAKSTAAPKKTKAPSISAPKTVKLDPKKIVTSADLLKDGDVGELDVVLKTLVGKKASVIIAADGSIYDVKLAKVDLTKNEDKYYVIQAVQDGKKTFLFIRWGKTGSRGQTELIAGDKAKVLDLFEKKFKEKTLCLWSDRDNFAKNDKGYDVLKVDTSRAKTPGRWEYYIDDYVDGKPTGWYSYDETGRENCEELWETYLANKSYTIRLVQSGSMGFQYLVDLTNMTQRNITTMKTRRIRRVPEDDRL